MSEQRSNAKAQGCNGARTASLRLCVAPLHACYDSAMKKTVGMMGSSAKPSAEMDELAFRLGKLIAEQGVVLITGATNGMPLASARGAKTAGGEVVGFSPAINKAEHERMGLPLQYHDLILYTGMGSHGRNLLNVRASNALIFAGGSMGALNEFTIAYDEQKIIGVLQGTGGFCDHLNEWMASLAKPGNRATIHYDSDPRALVQKVFTSLSSE